MTLAPYHRRAVSVAWLSAVVLLATPAGTAPSPSPAIAVGILHAPPFTIRGADGTWTGISIELWRQIAAELGLAYELRETDLPGLLQGLKDGRFEVGVAALTINAEREPVMDFSHPFYQGGLGVATRRGAAWRVLASRVFSRALAEIFIVITVLIFVVGAVVWIGERRVNADFPADLRRGLGAAFWWSAGTVTSVGYGDLTPRTLFGRVVAVAWMLAGLVLVSIFTAGASSILTSERLQSQVSGLDDLRHMKVIAVASTSGEEFLREERIRFSTRTRTIEALRALIAEEADAVIADAPIMRYLASNELDGDVEVGVTIFRAEQYGIGLRQESAWREPINRHLLARIAEPAWRDVLYRYIGTDR